MQNYKLKTKNHKQMRGQAALIAVVFMLALLLSGVFGASAIALKEARVAEGDTRSRNSFFAAEAGVDDSVYRLKNNKNVSSSFSISLNGSTATTTVADLPFGKKEIKSTGNYSGSLRGLDAILSTGGGASFNYGVQVGNGGVQMENTSEVIGSIYSNGDITGINSPSITVDAFAAGASKIDGMTVGGSARANLISNSDVSINASSTTDIDNSTVGKNAYADKILSSTIGNNAYYQTSISGSTVSGSSFPNTTPPVNLPALPMPISDQQLDAWENEAASGGTISGPCPYNPADGTTLGPVKITCDVEIDNNNIVTMKGPIWISGNFSIKNSAHLKLDSSFGAKSGVLIVDNASDRINSGKISVDNTAQILGSGSSGSYVFVASRNNAGSSCGDDSAILVKNSSNAAIYYAPAGCISIQNSSALKEVTGYKLEIKNSATVTYESGLANISFSSGPTGGYSIDSWGEIQP